MTRRVLVRALLAAMPVALACTALTVEPASADAYVKLYGYVRDSDGTVPEAGGMGGYEIGVSTTQYGFDWVTGSYHGYNGLAAYYHPAPADGSYEIDDLTPGVTYRLFFDDDYEPPNDHAYDMIVTAPSVDSRLDVQLEPRFTCTSRGTASGVREVGQTLTAPPLSSFTLSPTPSSSTPPVGYQWARYDPAQGWVPIIGARGTTYTLTAADQGYPVDVVVSVSDGDENDSPGGFAQCSWPVAGQAVQPAGSVPTPPMTSQSPSSTPAPAVVFGKTPKLAGVPDPGHKLKPPPLKLPPGGSITWQWFTSVGQGSTGLRISTVRYRGKPKPIRGAHHRTYKVKKKDRGKKIFLQMTISAPGYATTVVKTRPVRIR